ncbi:metallophosphoesterase [Bradyrhizobium sp. 157]|uniref:metallophosphoesterase family protein n=1 Tax=Bradyrhizobium sp. 157 TaxID=2782631 RepID=UPI001FF86963|nr:metallophosphoesterase [Bradyrhizobium sp. 157]MCK1640327.1 metallophosphoesterase [Bradyrhizobium sp. 157]
MGWELYRPDLETMNLVGYLTSDVKLPAPQMNWGTLHGFLDALTREQVDHAFVSSRSSWPQAIAACAADARKIFITLRGWPEPTGAASSSQVAQIVAPFRDLFRGYSIYALMVPPPQETMTPYPNPPKELAGFFREFAYDTGGEGLALMPHGWGGLQSVLDPFPALRALAEMPVEPPAVVFWSGLGATCCLSLKDAQEFFRREIRDNLAAGKGVIHRLVEARANEAGTKHLLHISDLHFGDATSDSSRRYIKSHLDRILSSVDRVVVTGDLFNSPQSAYLDQYLDFQSDVERMTDKPLIVIPGNHDVRPKGNVIPGILKSNYEFAFNIGWHPLVIDDELKCLFLCFNSAEEGNLARGRVTDGQRMRMAASLNEEANRRLRREQNIDDYTKIALVHHHPFAYETIPSAPYDRFLREVFTNEDSFTRLEEAEEFISWCAEREVSLILHGHKHVPHHVSVRVDIDGGRSQQMVVVGCGSTTGAEGSPLCYDVVSLNPQTGRWGGYVPS